MKYKINNIEISGEEIKRLIKENPEILKESKKGRVKSSETYFYLNNTGVVWITEEINNRIDDYNYNTLNYFHTEEEAQAQRERLLAIGKVTRAIEEINGDWVPDWGNDSQDKYYICYHDKEMHTGWTSAVKTSEILPYIKSKEYAETIIKNYDKELRLILGVK